MVHIFAISSLVLAAFAGFARPCSPPGVHISEIHLVESADIVLFGKVLGRMHNERYVDLGWSRAYDVGFEVYCTLKGSRQPRFVNISEAGFIAGLCASKNLRVGKEYLLLLHENSGKLTPSDEVPREGSPENVREILTACNLARAPPIGETELDPKCPAVATEETCIEPPSIPMGECVLHEDTYEDGETWLELSGECAESCECSAGSVNCARRCPPIGPLPPASPDCPKPHYADGECCKKFLCYGDVSAPEPPTTADATELPVTTSMKYDNSKANIVQNGDDSESQTKGTGGKTGESKDPSSATCAVTSWSLLATVVTVMALF